MKPLLLLLAAFGLCGCPSVAPRPPKVNVAPVGQSFDRIGLTPAEIDGIADDLERQGL